MTLKGGSTYWLMVDNHRIKPLSFLTGRLTEPQKRNVIERECANLDVSKKGARIELLRATTKWDYKVNG